MTTTEPAGPGRPGIPTERRTGWEWLLGVTLFATTIGPVYTLRTYLGPSVTAPWEHDWGVRVIFGALYLAIAVGLIREWETWKPKRLDASSVTGVLALAGLCVLAVASSYWALSRTAALGAGLLLTGTTLAGLAFGRVLTLERRLVVAGWALSTGTLLSLTSILVRWPGTARMADSGAWAGIYFNRNSLGPVTAVGALTTAVLAAVLRGRSRWMWGALALCNVVTLAGTRSATAAGALAVATVVFALGCGFRIYRSRGGSARVAGLVAGAGGLAAVVISNRWWFRLLEIVGRDDRLSGRRRLWYWIGVEINNRPWRGWGYDAYWYHPVTRWRLEKNALRFFPTAHNGFYEIQLGLGRVGAVVFSVAIGVVVWRVARTVWAHPHPAAAWTASVCAFVVFSNLTESFTLPNQFLWILGVAPVAAAVSSTGDGLPKRPRSAADR